VLALEGSSGEQILRLRIWFHTDNPYEIYALLLS